MSRATDNGYLQGVESTLNEWQEPFDEAAYFTLGAVSTRLEQRRTDMTQAELVFEHLKQLPEPLLAEVMDFVQFLEQKQARAEKHPPRQPGSAKGQIWIAEDFDAPLDDFRDYQ